MQVAGTSADPLHGTTIKPIGELIGDPPVAEQSEGVEANPRRAGEMTSTLNPERFWVARRELHGRAQGARPAITLVAVTPSWRSSTCIRCILKGGGATLGFSDPDTLPDGHVSARRSPRPASEACCGQVSG
jgi:hypothetical protein